MSLSLLEAHNLHWYNAHMRKQWLFLLFGLILLGLILSACAQDIPEEDQTSGSTNTATLQSIPDKKPTDTPLPTPSATPELSPTITQTPTPVYYQVLEGDDMYAIAYYYNISPQELMTANPSVNPRAIGPGTTLVIPVTLTPEPTSTGTVEQQPTPKMTFSTLPEPDCYPDALGGLWCFVLLSNEDTSAFENVTGVMELQQGDEKKQEIAMTPLNLLPSGQALPLVAYFQPPVDQDFIVSASVDFFLPVIPEDDRYLTVEFQEENITNDPDGKSASISGVLLFPEGPAGPAYVWICATAFDSDGHVLGVRRWESDQSAGISETLPFEFSIYSHGKPIESVALVVEAYRNQTPQD